MERLYCGKTYGIALQSVLVLVNSFCEACFQFLGCQFSCLNADDTQLYTDSDPRVAGDSNLALSNLSPCTCVFLRSIPGWCKTGCSLIKTKQNFGSPKVISILPHLELRVGDININPSTTGKNLGVTLDLSLLMNRHISTVCRSVNFHIRNLRRIRRFLTQDACHNADCKNPMWGSVGKIFFKCNISTASLNRK